jgi:hypothetical protein
MRFTGDRCQQFYQGILWRPASRAARLRPIQALSSVDVREYAGGAGRFALNKLRSALTMLGTR